MQHFFKRLKARLAPVFQSDTQFVEAAFLEILGRNADLDGLKHYQGVLRQGLGRTAVLLDIMRSEEFKAKLRPSLPLLPDLMRIRPEKYREAVDLTNGSRVSLFLVSSEADFDWLEAAIVANGYYEQPGVWTLGVDADKRVVAEMLSTFAPHRALELGCAAGAVLDCLQECGVFAEGVEISSMALERSSHQVRSRIHHGDLLSLDLTSGYDLVFGLDLFEHLNPNKVDAYISRIAQLTAATGWVFCNIPAFGSDAIFDTIFPMYIQGWEEAAANGQLFPSMQVDNLGYPIHGHLIWADARWWIDRFERHGFHREIEVERALHHKYDEYMLKRSPARRSFFVFSIAQSGDRRQRVLESIQATKSTAAHAN